MNDMAPGWEQQQANEEQEMLAIEAINRCAKAGAHIEDLKVLAAACGVDIKHTILGDEIRPRRVG